MKYYQIIPDLKKVVGLEFFVFVTFLTICILINTIIVEIPAEQATLFLTVVVGTFKVVSSAILVIVWLIVWYKLTKKMIRTEDIKEVKEEK